MSKDSSLANLELNPNDADVLIRFVGELNKNIKLVEKNFNVKIFQNGNKISISGDEENRFLYSAPRPILDTFLLCQLNPICRFERSFVFALIGASMLSRKS